MKKNDWFYGQNWNNQAQDAYNSRLLVNYSGRPLGYYLHTRNEPLTDIIMHIHWSITPQRFAWSRRRDYLFLHGYGNDLTP